jgi:hypothetical protein
LKYNCNKQSKSQLYITSTRGGPVKKILLIIILIFTFIITTNCGKSYRHVNYVVETTGVMTGISGSYYAGLLRQSQTYTITSAPFVFISSEINLSTDDIAWISVSPTAGSTGTMTLYILMDGEILKSLECISACQLSENI